jgi:hypothetical protein
MLIKFDGVQPFAFSNPWNIAMTTATNHLNAPDLSAEDYVVLGLATCFIKEDGEVHQVKVVEPIPSAALEAILKGIPTSYAQATATTIGGVLTLSSGWRQRLAPIRLGPRLRPIFLQVRLKRISIIRRSGSACSIPSALFAQKIM